MSELLFKPPNTLSLEKAKDLINEIKKIDLQSCKREVVSQFLEELKQHIAVIHILKAGSVICRTVSCDFLNGEYPTNVAQISYNPNLERCPFNRASWEKETAFYGCASSEIIESYNTSQMEVMGTLNDNPKSVAQELFVTGKWILQEDLKLVLLSGNLKNSTTITESRNGTFYKYAIREKESIIAMKLIDNFLCEEFCKEVLGSEKWKYKISAEYANLIKNDGWPGLLYPSFQSIGAGINVALFPKAIDDGLIKLERAAGVRYYKRDKKLVNEYVMEAIPDGNILRWKETYKHRLPNHMKAYYTGKSNNNSFEKFISYKNLD